MNTIKIKNKLVTYSEELTGNTYKLIFDYIKPANAHNNALKIEGTLDVFFNLEDKVSYDKVSKEVRPSGRLYINNKYISTRSNLYKENENLYLSEWISAYEYGAKFSSLNILTESDANMINNLIIAVTKNSDIFTYKNISPGADAESMRYELKKAFENIKEYYKEFEEAKIKFNDLLLKYDLTQGEFDTFICFTDEDMSAVDAIKAARVLK